MGRNNSFNKNRSSLKSQKANRQCQRTFDASAHRLFKKTGATPVSQVTFECTPPSTSYHPSPLSVRHRGLSILFVLMLLTSCFIQQAQAARTNVRRRDASLVTADELNQLYRHTTPCENGAPAYQCSGIIIHGQIVPDKDNPLPAWYLPAYRNIGSFSYLRADITPHVGEPVYINTGFILTPMNKLEERNEFPYKLYCEFPGDGATVGDADSACHFNNNDYGTICGDEIQSIDDFIKKYFGNQPPGAYWNPGNSGCSFLPTTDRFNLTMELHKYIYRENSNRTECSENTFCRVHNELIIGTWDIKSVSDIEVPILAFYAIINDTFNPMFKRSGRTNTSKAELHQLFKDSDAYYEATNRTRRIPVVTLDMGKLRSGAEDVFAPAVRPG